MNALLQQKKVVLGAAGAAVAIIVIGGWLLLVSPARSKATELATQVDTANSDLSVRQAALRNPAAKMTVRASDSYRLSKALPTAVDMPGVILDVQRLVSQNELAFISIAPQPTGVAGIGYVATPVGVNVQGRFADVSKFLEDLRSLVRVRNDRLDTRGRLYSVESVNIGAPQDPATFPVVLATLKLNTFAFSPPPPAVATPSPSTSASGQSTSEAVAAGATP